MSDPGQRDGDPLLPVGTVTLLLADVEGSTGLWERAPTEMRGAVERLDEVVAEVIGAHGGVRPVEQGEGDSFVAAFPRASDAAACALDLQRADLAPIRLRIGLHTGEVQLRDEGNYIGPAVNRCARIRDLGHGGQTVLSAATHDLVADLPPAGAWFDDRGWHRLRDLARPEHVFQLCHADVECEFPPLRSLDAFEHNLPIQLTTFVGRTAELAEVRELLGASRLVTLTGAGGAGKTRLAVQLGADTLADHPDGVWLIELAPVADPDLVALAVARGLGLRDDPVRTTTETIVHHLGERRALVILDNCEQVVAASAELAEGLLRSCPSIHLLVTSREPLGVSGEVTWRIPSLTLPEEGAPTVAAVSSSEAVQLFTECARRSRPDFQLTAASAPTVAEICRRLDGIPLALELAAARMRVFSPEQIAAGLADRFRLLTGGSRTAVPRQQTLMASVDWSHDLLTDPERLVFRRLAVFVGAFDFQAAEAVAGADGLEAYQVLDQLSLLVDKSLVLADEVGGLVRYRLLETVRSYALEKLLDSGEVQDTQRRHRDHYLSVTTSAARGVRSFEQDAWLDRLEDDILNLRAAFDWSRDQGDIEDALRIVCALEYVWVFRGRYGEGRAWLDEALAQAVDVTLAIHIAALALRGQIEGAAFGLDLGWSERAIEMARGSGDPALIARALTSAGMTTAYWGTFAGTWTREAIELARHAGDAWRLAEALSALGIVLATSGQPVEARPVLEECLALASEQGNRVVARLGAALSSMALSMQGELVRAREMATETAREARSTGDRTTELVALTLRGWTLAEVGDSAEASRATQAALEVARELGMPPLEALPLMIQAMASLAGGDAETAQAEAGEAWGLSGGVLAITDISMIIWAESALALGDLVAATERATEAVERTGTTHVNWFRAAALTVLARTCIQTGDRERAERLILEAAAVRRVTGDAARMGEILEVLAELAALRDDALDAVRLRAAASAVRVRSGVVPFEVYRKPLEAQVASLREALGDEPFEAAWAEGAELFADDALALVAPMTGDRKRAAIGWDSLTPAELDIAGLVAEGLPNKQIAQRLGISPRTVQAHLTHIYTKLDVTSRVQLANEAAQHR